MTPLQEATDALNAKLPPLQEATPNEPSLPEATSSLQVATTGEQHDVVHEVQEGMVLSSVNQDLADSDTTIIYNPAEAQKDKKKQVFTTITHGIKITKRSCMYTCPKCGIKKQVYNPSTSIINAGMTM